MVFFFVCCNLKMIALVGEWFYYLENTTKQVLWKLQLSSHQRECQLQSEETIMNSNVYW